MKECGQVYLLFTCIGQKLLQHKCADVGHPTAPADWARAAAWEDGSLHCCTGVVERQGDCGRNILFN